MGLLFETSSRFRNKMRSAFFKKIHIQFQSWSFIRKREGRDSTLWASLSFPLAYLCRVRIFQHITPSKRHLERYPADVQLLKRYVYTRCPFSSRQLVYRVAGTYYEAGKEELEKKNPREWKLLDVETWHIGYSFERPWTQWGTWHCEEIRRFPDCFDMLMREKMFSVSKQIL